MKFLQDIKYTVKMVAGIFSGYDGLQRSTSDGWEYIAYTQTQSMDYAGELTRLIEFDLIEQPYYVCVSWNNHTHLPLPILLDGESEYKMQNLVVKFLHWLWGKTPFFPSAFECAVMDCAHYENQFDQWAQSEDDGLYLSEATLKELVDLPLEFDCATE